MIDGCELIKIATGLTIAGTLAMLPACGTGNGGSGAGADATAGVTQPEDSGDGTQDGSGTADATSGGVSGEGDGNDTVVEADGGTVNGTGKDEYAPKSASKGKASKSGDSEDAEGAAGSGDATPYSELRTDGNQIVLQYEGDESTRLVFRHDGDVITAFESYVDYGTETVARNVAMGLSDAHDDAIKSVKVEGSCVVIEHSPRTYENLTVGSLESAYPDAIRI